MQMELNLNLIELRSIAYSYRKAMRCNDTAVAISLEYVCRKIMKAYPKIKEDNLFMEHYHEAVMEGK